MAEARLKGPASGAGRRDERRTAPRGRAPAAPLPARPSDPHELVRILQAHAGNRALSGLLSPAAGLPAAGAPLPTGAVADLGARLLGDAGRVGAVRIYTGGAAAATALRLGAAAYTVGTHIVFAPGRYQPETGAGCRLLAHELAHVQQALEGPSDARSQPADADHEGDADRAAQAALAGGPLPLARSRPGSALRMQAQPDAFDVLRRPETPSAAEAEEALRQYAALTSDQKDAFVRAFHQVGVIDSPLRRWLSALPKASLRGHRALLADIGQRLEQYGTEQASGKTLTELGRAEAALLVAQADQDARKKAAARAPKTGGVPPAVTPADIARAHQETAEAESPVHRADLAEDKSPWGRIKASGAEAAWRARAARVIPAVVQACSSVAPELGITAKNIVFAPEVTDGPGDNVFARSGDPLSVGLAFVETAEADPRYVVSVVVHEISGHPEYGPSHRAYAARIYEEAHRQAPELGEPWGFGPHHIYGYIGTETYAALREVPYARELSREDQARGLGRSIPPDQNVANKMGLIKKFYPTGVAEAVVQGLYERYRTDPRITDEALALFESKASEAFPGALKGVPRRGPRPTVEFGAGAGVERAGGRSRAYGEVEVSAVLQWATATLGAGGRLEAVAGDRESFVRLGLQSKLHVQLYRGLYADLRGGYVWGVGSASGGPTGGAGVSYDFGAAQLGLVYDVLKSANDQDPYAHRALLTLG